MNNRTRASLFFPLLCLKLSLSLSPSPLISSPLKPSRQPSRHSRRLSQSCIASDPCFVICLVVSPLSRATRFYLLLSHHLVSPCCYFTSPHLLVPSPSALALPLGRHITPSCSLSSPTISSFPLQSTVFPQVFPNLPLAV